MKKYDIEFKNPKGHNGTLYAFLSNDINNIEANAQKALASSSQWHPNQFEILKITPSIYED